jgi:hypothetical protein
VIWLVGGHNHIRTAAGVALAACVVLIAWEYLSGLRRNSLDWDTLGIIVLFIIALATPLSWSNRWFVPLGNAALFALMLGTILIGRPFAEEYGKESAPAEVWNIRAFRQATLGISVVWTAAVGVIVVGFFITALKPSTEVWPPWVVTAGAIIIAMKFQHWYPEQVARTYVAKAQRY